MKKNLLTALFALITFVAFAQNNNVISRTPGAPTEVFLDTYCEADDDAKTNTVISTKISWIISHNKADLWTEDFYTWGPELYPNGTNWYEFRMGTYRVYKFDVYRINMVSGEEELIATVYQQKDQTSYEYTDDTKMEYSYGDANPNIKYVVKAESQTVRNMVEMRRYNDQYVGWNQPSKPGALSTDGLTSYSATHQYTYYPAAEVSSEKEWFPAWGFDEHGKYTSLWGRSSTNEYYMCGRFFQDKGIGNMGGLSGNELAEAAYNYIEANLAGKEDGVGIGFTEETFMYREYPMGTVGNDVMTITASVTPFPVAYIFQDVKSVTIRKDNEVKSTGDTETASLETQGTEEYNGNYFGRITLENGSTWGFGPLVFDAIATGVETVGTDAATVVGANGKINILNSDAEVFVYSVNGQMIYSGMNREIACNAGLYIVKLGNKTYKVLLK